jgi:hypothetical protein
MNSTVAKFLAATAAVILVFGVVAVAHRWLADSFGASVATVTVFAFFGVALAVVLWVASAKFTMAIYKAALHHSEYVQDGTARTMRALAPSYNAAERQHLVEAKTQLTALRIAARETREATPTTQAQAVEFYEPADADAEQPPATLRFPRRQRRVDITYL